MREKFNKDSIQTPKKREFMFGDLRGIPREAVSISGAQYRFPSIDAVREEQQMLTSGLNTQEERKAREAAYENLLTLLEKSKELLTEVSEKESLSDGVTERGGLLMSQAQMYFDRAVGVARNIEKIYQRVQRGEPPVDTTLENDTVPKPDHKIDKKV